MDELLPSFFDEMRKISKAKLSGDEVADADVASQLLQQTTRTQARGPHPALNLEGNA